VKLQQRLVVLFFRGLTSLICRIDDAQLARVPRRGPLIIYTNHVNIIEIPIIYTRLYPRPIHGLAYADRWKSRLVGWLLDVCESIPLHRGEPDITAIRAGLERLREGHILLISPEGTRSGHGRLQVAHAGVVMLALHSGAPLLPIAYVGGERYKKNLRKLRRTDFHLVVGQPLRLEARGARPTREAREQMLNELMHELAALMPVELRGEFSSPPKAPTAYVHRA
jgi:1-acyl-sn-glycerol-3-phosphate acyltransferase